MTPIPSRSQIGVFLKIPPFTKSSLSIMPYFNSLYPSPLNSQGTSLAATLTPPDRDFPANIIQPVKKFARQIPS
jgi:hypothetical protein